MNSQPWPSSGGWSRLPPKNDFWWAEELICSLLFKWLLESLNALSGRDLLRYSAKFCFSKNWWTNSMVSAFFMLIQVNSWIDKNIRIARKFQKLAYSWFKIGTKFLLLWKSHNSPLLENSIISLLLFNKLFPNIFGHCPIFSVTNIFISYSAFDILLPIELKIVPPKSLSSVSVVWWTMDGKLEIYLKLIVVHVFDVGGLSLLVQAYKRDQHFWILFSKGSKCFMNPSQNLSSSQFPSTCKQPPTKPLKCVCPTNQL